MLDVPVFPDVQIDPLAIIISFQSNYDGPIPCEGGEISRRDGAVRIRAHGFSGGSFLPRHSAKIAG